MDNLLRSTYIKFDPRPEGEMAVLKHAEEKSSQQASTSSQRLGSIESRKVSQLKFLDHWNPLSYWKQREKMLYISYAAFREPICYITTNHNPQIISQLLVQLQAYRMKTNLTANTSTTSISFTHMRPV